MALLLLLALLLITVASSYFFLAKTWWFPAGASASAAGIDHQFSNTFLLMGIVFIAAQLLLAFFVFKFRDRNRSNPAQHTHGNLRLELLWTALTLFLFGGMNLMSNASWAQDRFRSASSEALQVEVTGMQFAWYFRYAGPDDKFGVTRLDLIDPPSGNDAAIGLDPRDPASRDDIVSQQMFVPVNREVELILRAQDVIHSFFVPAMRFKQDAVPGLAIRMHFKPITIGDYEIACSQLCGLGHYKMHATLHVVSPQDFDNWLAAREAEKQ